MKKGSVIWLCGLAGSGKSTLAQALCQNLQAQLDNVVHLDGDELRDLFGHFDYDKAGRIQMALKRALLAKLLSRQGIIAVVSTISLFNEVYQFNRANLPNYFEIFVDCNMDELHRRDQKQLYTSGHNVVGKDIAFDPPRAHFVIENHERKNLEEKTAQLLCAFLNFYKNCRS